MENRKAGNNEGRLNVFLSLVLQHQLEAADVILNEHGWADVEDLIQGISGTGRPMDMELLEDIVKTDEKGRYSFNGDRTLVRVNQGHSIPVDVELTETAPLQILYHETASHFEQAVPKQDLKSMSCLYVHLSGDAKTALTMGRRHENLVMFEVDSGRMSRSGKHFYVSQNGV